MSGPESRSNGALDSAPMRVRLISIAAVATTALLALAPAALGADGVGTYGRTDDKVITFFAFGVMAFFAILVVSLSLIQIRLDRRKERRTQDLERLGS
jgi:hypothetical protein